MARFYVRFDGGTETTLQNDFFDKVIITNGTNKRTGLIDSRSVVSADVYDNLNTIYRDGTKGTYFPPDTLTVPNNPFTATAYTSSVDGIVIPANYRTRVTGSIVSTQTSLVGITNPLSQVSVSYPSYVSASTAVLNVLNSISNGGPYGRVSFNVSRTLHSIWHDPDLQYFAWDDFTPGQITKPTITQLGGYPILNVGNELPQYSNDRNPAAPLTLALAVAPDYRSGEEPKGTCTRTLDILSGSVFFNANTSGTGPSNCTGGGNSTWSWDGSAGVLTWTIATGGGKHVFQGGYRVHDPVIQTHTSYSRADDFFYNAPGDPASPSPTPQPPPNYCVQSCTTLQYTANWTAECGGSCPNCSGAPDFICVS